MSLFSKPTTPELLEFSATTPCEALVMPADAKVSVAELSVINPPVVTMEPFGPRT